jgi:hypothetical protein
MIESKPKEVTADSETRFAWNWKQWLQPNDTISTYVIVPTAGLTLLGTATLDGAVVKALLRVDPAAVVGQKLSALCTITTAQGFKQNRTIFMKVVVS